MKPYRFENAPLLAAFLNRPGFGNSPDRCRKTMRLRMKPRFCKRCLKVDEGSREYGAKLFLLLSSQFFVILTSHFSRKIRTRQNLHITENFLFAQKTQTYNNHVKFSESN